MYLSDDSRFRKRHSYKFLQMHRVIKTVAVLKGSHVMGCVRTLGAKAGEGLVVTTQKSHGIYVITLNNPAKLNALTGTS